MSTSSDTFIMVFALLACGLLWPTNGSAEDKGGQHPDETYGFKVQPKFDLPGEISRGEEEEAELEQQPFQDAAKRYFGLMRLLRLDWETLQQRGVSSTGTPWRKLRHRAALRLDLEPIEKAYRSVIDRETIFVLTSSPFSRRLRSAGPRQMDTLAAVEDGRLYPLYVSPSRLIDGFLRSPDGDSIAIVRFQRSDYGGGQPNRSIDKIHLEVLDLNELTVTHTVVSAFEEKKWVKLTWTQDSEGLYLRSPELTDVRCEADTLSCRRVDTGATPEPMVQLLYRKRPGIHATVNTAFHLDPVPMSLWRRLQVQPVAGQVNPETIRVGPEGKWVAYESFQSELMEASAHWWHGDLNTTLWVLNRKTGERRRVTEAKDFSHTRWRRMESDELRLLYDAQRAPTDAYKAATERAAKKVVDPSDDEDMKTLKRRRAVAWVNRRFEGRRWNLQVMEFDPETGTEAPWLKTPLVRLLAQERYAGNIPETRD